MYCSCPHAESGYNCKHMAAVLYYFYNKNLDKEVVNKEESAAEIVAKTSEEVVRKYLTTLLEEDKILKIRFKNFIDKGLNNEDIESYKIQVDIAIRKNQGRDGFISFYEADNFYYSIKEFLNSDIRMM